MHLATGISAIAYVRKRQKKAQTETRGAKKNNRATKDRTRDNWSLATKRIVMVIHYNYNPMLYQLSYRTCETLPSYTLGNRGQIKE